ncbi:MAG: hypothetical protein ACKOFW_22875, partial [Planctomycetaceae bacterium]
FSGGSQGADLVLTMTAATPTAAQINAIAQRVTFRNTSDNPNTGTRTVAFRYASGTLVGSNTKDVTITAVNDAPTLGNSGTVNYTENNTTAPFDVPVLLHSAGTIADVDSADLNTGVLTVTITANGTSNDRLSIVAGTPSGFLAVSTSGSNVLYGGSVVGTFTGGTGTTPLAITFNSALATPVAATAILRQIGFATLGDSPSTLTRTIQYSLTDGDGGTLTPPATGAVTVTGVDDPPAFQTLPSAAVPENQAFVGQYLAIDPEGQTVTYSVSGTDASRFTIDASGNLSFKTTPVNYTPDYENPTDANSDNVYELTVTATAGGVPTSTNVSVSVTPVNEFAPQLTGSL